MGKKQSLVLKMQYPKLAALYTVLVAKITIATFGQTEKEFFYQSFFHNNDYSYSVVLNLKYNHSELSKGTKLNIHY